MNEQQELIDATKEWLNKAKKVYNRDFMMPSIAFDLGGAVAGRAWSSRWHIQYNMELYIRNKETFTKRTVPHELAHLIANNLHGKRVKPHGWEWKNVMLRLGVEDIKRCHSYDVSEVKNERARPFIYSCNCSEHPLTKTKHRRILMGYVYVCNKCKSKIVWKQKQFA